MDPSFDWGTLFLVIAAVGRPVSARVFPICSRGFAEVVGSMDVAARSMLILVATYMVTIAVTFPDPNASARRRV